MKDVRDEVDTVLRAAAHRDGEHLIVGWVLVFETLNSDEARELRITEHKGCTSWQRDGYLHNALRDEGWEPKEFDT